MRSRQPMPVRATLLLCLLTTSAFAQAVASSKALAAKERLERLGPEKIQKLMASALLKQSTWKQSDRDEMVSLFIDGHGDPNLTIGNMPLLTFAACSNNIRIIKYLLQSGAEVEARGPDGFTAVRAAIDCGTVEIIIALLEHKANVNALDDYGQSPLWAVTVSQMPEKQAIKIARTLVDHGARPFLPNDKVNNGTALIRTLTKNETVSAPENGSFEYFLVYGIAASETGKKTLAKFFGDIAEKALAKKNADDGEEASATTREPGKKRLTQIFKEFVNSKPELDAGTAPSSDSEKSATRGVGSSGDEAASKSIKKQRRSLNDCTEHRARFAFLEMCVTFVTEEAVRHNIGQPIDEARNREGAIAQCKCAEGHIDWSKAKLKIIDSECNLPYGSAMEVLGWDSVRADCYR